MRLFVRCPRVGNIPWEILSHDPAAHTAVVRNVKGEVWTDPNFHPKFLKSVGWIMFTEVPSEFKKIWDEPTGT